jgi:hypothetical protein
MRFMGHIIVQFIAAFIIITAAEASEDDESYIISHNMWCHKINVAKGFVRENPNHEDRQTLTQKDENELEDKARRELLLQLRAIIGTFTPILFNVNEISLSPLAIVSTMDYLDSYVDGILFRVDIYNARILVTTHTLLSNWLAGNECGLERGVTDIHLELLDPIFYREAMTDDPEFDKIAELPIVAPAYSKTAFAFLAHGDDPVNGGGGFEIYVGVEFAKRIYIVGANPPFDNLPTIPECDIETRQFRAAADQAWAKAVASKPHDESLVRQSRFFRAKAWPILVKCFNSNAKTQPFFQDWVKEAQFLADNLQPD